MIDMDRFMEKCKAYQNIIDNVTIDECICVAMGIPINCNHEEMIVRSIIQRLWKAEESKNDSIEEFANWLVKYKVIPDGAMQELLRDFRGEMKKYGNSSMDNSSM